jgi:hypothetical protein
MSRNKKNLNSTKNWSASENTTKKTQPPRGGLGAAQKKTGPANWEAQVANGLRHMLFLP